MIRLGEKYVLNSLAMLTGDFIGRAVKMTNFGMGGDLSYIILKMTVVVPSWSLDGALRCWDGPMYVCIFIRRYIG